MSSITKNPMGGHAPLSLAQRRLWFLYQLDPQSPEYNISRAWQLKGSLNTQALETSLNLILARHETLRTIFQDIDGQPVQVIRPTLRVPLQESDWSSYSPTQLEAEIDRFLIDEPRQPFDLLTGPLLRFTLIRCAPDDHVLVFTVHHMVCDGTSLKNFCQELSCCYAATLAGQPNPLAPLPIQYQDFAYWQQTHLTDDKLASQLAFWKQHLHGAPPVLELPSDGTRPKNNSGPGNYQAFTLAPQAISNLKQLTQPQGITMFMALLAVFQILLTRYTGQRDILVGTPISGRTHTDLEDLIGFLVNTLVLRTQIVGQPTFQEVLRQVRKTCLEAYRHQDLPFEKLVEALNPVRDSSRYPVVQAIFQLRQLSDCCLTFPEIVAHSFPVKNRTGNFDLHMVCEETESGIQGFLYYPQALFSDTMMAGFAKHYEILLEELIANPQRPISQISFLSHAERHKQLFEWNNTATAYPKEQSLPQLFEAQVAERPDAVAVVHGDEQLTYGQLNVLTNQLAHLLQQKGVGSDTVVGVVLPRSGHFIVGLLGIVKAGGAYLPIDPLLPQSRVAFMLQDAQASVVVTTKALSASLGSHSPEVVCVEVDTEQLATMNAANSRTHSSSSNLVYVIYTSGSTGAPKGVAITQQNLLNLVRWHQQTFDVSSNDRATQLAGLSFDATGWEIWPYLLQGAGLVLSPDEEVRTVPEKLRDWLVTEQITLSFLPTPLVESVLPLPWPTSLALRAMLTGGDQLHHYPSPTLPFRLVNNYGPTENTVVTTSIVILPATQTREAAPSIGHPIANTEAYILDRHLQPVPVGVPGELYICGAGLGRGYLRRSALTAEKFVPHPFSAEPGTRVYRTGDRARYRREGNLEFVGRQDTQIKLRGYRIELGEIESVLRSHSTVQETVVLCREDGPGEKQLVAYVVAEGVAVVSELREYLQTRLPVYMIPAVFVILKQLPLTPNGKVNRRALPAPDGTRPDLEAPFQSPHPGVEQCLAEIWQQLLRVDHIGRHDNFFELGGDSILGIQIVAKANQAGLRMTPQQIFQHQTIADLATEVVTGEPVTADQGVVTGPLPLTPIQHWVFEQLVEKPHHWNMAWALEAKQPLDPKKMEQVVEALLTHHDALRLRFTRQDGGWRQELCAPGGNSPFTFFDWSSLLSSLSSAEVELSYTQEADRLQSSLHLTDRPLIQVALFHFGSGRPDRLLLIIHHLAVDGISWRILIEDLQTAYNQLNQGLILQLPPKTSSFNQWAERIVRYAQSETLNQELCYWQRVVNTPCAPLPRDFSEGINTVASTQTVSISLTRQETQALLQIIPEVYHTHINDVLLTALVDTMAQWTQQETVLIDLESHGREDLFEGIDLSRTVGWFTSIFPVVLKRGHPTHPGDSLKSIKEQLRQIPHRGIGYGLLRYLRQEIDLQLQHGASRHPEVSFNYLGQFDQVLPESALFTWSQASVGSTRSPSGNQPHLVAVTGQIVGDILQVQWHFSEGVHRRSTMEALAKNYLAALHAVILHCQSPEAGGYTPSDFPLAKISQVALDSLLNGVQAISGRAEIADLYPLTHLQQGLWFHAQAAPESKVYFEQKVSRIEGVLDVGRLRRAWQEVVARHAILRTGLIWEGLEHPLQLVHPTVGLPWEEHDWRGSPAHETPVRLTNFLDNDRARGFDLAQAPLMRLTLIQVTESTAFFVWSFHHVILDRWSVDLVQQEVWAAYRVMEQGRPLEFKSPRPYREFLSWLSQQDLAQAEIFWRKVLAGFVAPTVLGIDQVPGREGLQEGVYDSQQYTLSEPATASLHRFSRQHHLTLNTVVQGAWALLLSRYSGREDVLFGATVAGRSAGPQGLGTMVGLFINTLPIRVKMSQRQSVTEWLTALQAQQVTARQYEYTPLFEIQQWSEMPPGVPLFNTIFVFENTPRGRGEGETSRLTVKAVTATKSGGSNYPLTVVVVPDRTLQLRITYDTEHYTAEVIIRVFEHFQQVLERMTAQPDKSLSTITILTEAERRQQLMEWNDTVTSYPKEQSLPQLFEAQVAERPDAVAVVCEDEQLTYRKLNARANQLAHSLQRQGVGPEVRVGVCLERGIDFLVSLLAVLKAGGAYVPLDPSAPTARLASLLDDAAISLVLTQEEQRAALPATIGAVVVLDAVEAVLAREAVTPLNVPVSSGQLAYIMYTSGSTGQPKGTLISQRSVVRLVKGTQYAQLDAQQRFLQVAPMAFDASTFEVWGSLLNGATLVVYPPGPLAIDDLGGALEEERISTVWLTAGLFHQLVEQHGAQLGQVEQVLAGGDVLAVGAVQELLKNMGTGRVINGYGPTENTTFTCCHSMNRTSQLEGTVPIGRPISNTQGYVLDQQQQLVPVGVFGELYVGGEGLAWGYLNQPGLTAEKFIPHPYSQESGARLYRTGDQVRWRPEGALEFQGRQDTQSKLRGYRIELGEIEGALRDHPAVTETVVVCREDMPGEKQLVAYVVGQAPVSELRPYLQGRLPGYMVPALFVLLETLPLTLNGKIDRKALPTPGAADHASEIVYVAPRTVLEELVAEVWQEVLKVERIGVNDNFFELGGHSLLATRVIARLRQVLELTLPLRTIFEHPTIAQLAQAIDTQLPNNISDWPTNKRSTQS